MKVLRIVFNDKQGNCLLYKEYEKECFAIVSMRSKCLQVFRQHYLVDTIYFEDYKQLDSYSIYNYD